MQPQTVFDRDGRILGSMSWADGFKPVKRSPRRLSESEAQAHALWLERHVSSEAGIDFLDAWLAGKTALFPIG